MPYIQYYKQPELRDPVVIVAFAGWNDAADAATTATKILIDRWAPTKIAEIDSEDFFVFTETRPTVKYTDGIQRTIVWPSNQFLSHIAPELPHDVILFVGNEPQLKWKTFSKVFLEVCRNFKASEIVFLGALLADIPHSIPVPITGTSSDSDMMERLREMDVHRSRYEGPTGMIGVLHDACRRIQLPSASLWAAAPHYLAMTPNIKVTAALLTYLNAYLSLGLDLSGVQSDALHFEEQITALVARDPEAKAYVQKLEEQLAAQGLDEAVDEENEQSSFDEITSTGPLPSADTLIRDVEELLRQERENGQNKSYDDTEDNE
ncbi:MAG: PAC2 family protein [Chloroflexi bacterium]|nr:MAG: PAC2 family protein [Chloroflexota bacterium]